MRSGVNVWEANMIRIVVADERRLILEVIAETLKRVHDFEVVAIVNETRQIIPTVLRVLPAVAVLSATGRDELHLANELRGAVPSCGITVISSEPTTRAMMTLAAGVFSVVPSDRGLAHLIHGIRGVVAGHPATDSRMFDTPRPNGQGLSNREAEVLRLTATGAPVREIATELYLSPGTVRNLTSSAIKKLQARNRFDAARIASERGWL
jgi:two-component system response regulator DesR